MKSKLPILLVLAVAIQTLGQEYKLALPGYHFEFPRDHFDHADYATEWWYYTGNLRAADGHRFGFELTFFRQAVDRGTDSSPWSIRDLYMAHLALSDVSGGRFYSSERINRAGPGVAGVHAETGLIWNGNWQMKIGESAHKLRGISANFALDLSLSPTKPPVIHGTDGVSQKTEGVGHASHYVSFTRMKTTGTIELDGVAFRVEGASWMDHEFFSDSTNANESGWDWLSLQLNDNTELMLYRMRHKDGSGDPYSSGTYVDAQGKTLHLSSRDFTMTPAGPRWMSGQSGGDYPIGWQVDVPGLDLHLAISTPLKNQELVSRFGPTYWEGAIDAIGQRGGSVVHGEGYLEMTGYARSTANKQAVQAYR